MIKKVYDVKQVNCFQKEFEDTEYFGDPESSFQVCLISGDEYKKFQEDKKDLEYIFCYIVDAWTGVDDDFGNPMPCNLKTKKEFVEKFPDFATLVVNQAMRLTYERETI